ncbi:sugar ABC transporter permease [Actinomadura montaniterrae]|uniref:Sugar ABC transporter permease n=1 Tax=Actinomadura montaniterrae TaxID=1803903 RepID=A0A6L3W795_9ACTN|nr:sugar ABC transporter permease [Actinomadura montaniterrae]
MILARFLPTLAGAGYAFTDWNGLSGARFVGPANFEEIFTDPLALRALRNTIVIALVVVCAGNLVGLLLAMGLNTVVKSRYLLRAVFFLPAVMSSLSTAYVWKFLFQTDGIINHALHWLHLQDQPRSWLADPATALWSVCLVMIWQMTGLAMVIYLAGLQAIPADLDEAAAVDGASPWRRTLAVTLPLLRPATMIAVPLVSIVALGTFDQVMSLTGGGPVNMTETLATQVYKQTFANGRYGYGTALSLVLTLIIVVVALVQMVAVRPRKDTP